MKRILSLFIALCMSLTMLINVSATSDYEKELLSALSIMQGDPNGNMRYEDKVSRAECAKIVVATSAYRNNVSTDEKISPFKDVTYTHWASPYVAAGIKYGLFKGYLDATFRPSNTVLYEEAITMFLRVLGYSDEDFGNDWPYDQIDLAKNIGLLDNINKTVGQQLTRRDVSAMAYNTLMSKPKNSSNTHISSFNKTIGPKTVTSSNWYEDFGADSTITVVRDGVKVSLLDVTTNDIAYYMEEYNTALVYSKKVTGIYENATPNKEAPTSVTVSGISYNIEGIDAYSKLSAGGAYKYGDTVTLLLGKTGDIADIATDSQLKENVSGFLVASGTKQTTVSGTSVTKPFARVILATGETREYITNKDYSKLLNQPVNITLENSVATISAISQNKEVSGKFVWSSSEHKLGTTTLSDNVKILEVSTTQINETAVCATVFPQRLNGFSLSSSNILYVSKNSSGYIDELILTDTTGDMHTYGIITSAKSNMEPIISGSYEYITDGSTKSIVTNNKAFTVSSGQAVKITTDGKSVSSISAISKVATGKVSDIKGSSLSINGKIYTISDKLQIYIKNANNYTMITKEELLDNKDNYQATVYADKNSSSGRVRIIVLS